MTLSSFLSTLPESNKILCDASDFEAGAMKQSEDPSRTRCGTLPMQLRTFTYRQDLVTALQLPAQVGRAARQDEGDEDALAIFTTHDVEAQAGGALVEHDLPGFPVQTVQIVHQLGGVAGPQHLQARLGGDERWMATLAEVDKCLSRAFLRQGRSSHTTGSPQGDDALLRSLAPNSTSTEQEHCHMLTHILL